MAESAHERAMAAAHCCADDVEGASRRGHQSFASYVLTRFPPANRLRVKARAPVAIGALPAGLQARGWAAALPAVAAGWWFLPPRPRSRQDGGLETRPGGEPGQPALLKAPKDTG